MAKQKIEIEVDVPEGWIGVEYRPLEKGDWYLNHDGPMRSNCETVAPWLILRKIEPVRESRWRNVYPKDHATYAYYYKSYEEAHAALCDRAKAEGGRVERIDFEDGKIVNVALEPKEGEG